MSLGLKYKPERIIKALGESPVLYKRLLKDVKSKLDKLDNKNLVDFTYALGKIDKACPSLVS